jgi:hypothetical protein
MEVEIGRFSMLAVIDGFGLLKMVIFIFDTVITSVTGCKAFYYSEEDV